LARDLALEREASARVVGPLRAEERRSALDGVSALLGALGTPRIVQPPLVGAA
jgi:hypothetical protein